jgi:protein TonB
MDLRLAITPRIEGLTTTVVELTAGEKLAAPLKTRRQRPWNWVAAALLHAVVIALLFVTLKERRQEQAQSPPGISVVFDHGGTPRETAPQVQRQGPSQQASAPQPAAPPPPPAAVAQEQPEVNLNLPQMETAPLPEPLPQPAPQTRAVPHPTRHYVPTQHYLVLNNPSFGQPSPPLANARRGLNLNLAQSDAQAANAPEISVQGDVGADWDAELDQWVNQHKYYPDSAAEQGQEGDVQIHFVVDRNGNVTGLRMLSSSGSPFLDQAWLGLFENAQLPPFPPGTKANDVSIDATMHFVLIR